jgi:hypothetical protein
MQPSSVTELLHTARVNSRAARPQNPASRFEVADLAQRRRFRPDRVPDTDRQPKTDAKNAQQVAAAPAPLNPGREARNLGSQLGK